MTRDLRTNGRIFSTGSVQCGLSATNLDALRMLWHRTEELSKRRTNCPSVLLEPCGRHAGLADSKSSWSNPVWVRVPPSVLPGHPWSGMAMSGFGKVSPKQRTVRFGSCHRCHTCFGSASIRPSFSMKGQLLPQYPVKVLELMTRLSSELDSPRPDLNVR